MKLDKSKPKPRHYYDWIFDIKPYFGFKSLKEVFNKDDITANGCMVDIDNYEPIQHTEQTKNREKIYQEFGECKIYVWW
jgi:hypothetical protein